MALIQEQNFRLAALAGMIAVASAYCSLILAGSETASDFPRHRKWPAGAAVALGSGIWAAGVLGLVALLPAFGASFTISPLIYSFLIALAGCGISFYAATEEPRRPGARSAATVLLAIAIGASTLVPALSLPVSLGYVFEPVFLWADALLALGASALTIWFLASNATGHRSSSATLELVAVILGLVLAAEFSCTAMGVKVSGAFVGLGAESSAEGSALIAVAIGVGIVSILGSATVTAINDRSIRAAQLQPAQAKTASKVSVPTLLVSEVEAPLSNSTPAPNIMSLSAAVALAGKSVLIAETSTNSQELLLSLLGGWHVAPLLAASCKQAMEQMQRAKDGGLSVDLILLDSRLGDGAFTLVEQVRERFGETPPIVLLVDAAERAPRAETLKSFGISSHVVKPVWRADLEHAMLNALLSEAQSKQERGTNLAASETGRTGSRSKLT